MTSPLYDFDEEHDPPRTITAASVRVRPVEWLRERRIPRGKLTLLDGNGGLGKSTILLDIGARVTTGRPMPGETNGAEREPHSVLHLSAEDDWGDTVRPRLEAAHWSCPATRTPPTA